MNWIKYRFVLFLVGRTAHQKPPRSFHANNASAASQAGRAGSPSASIATTTDEEGGFNDPSPEIVARLRPHALAVTPTNSATVQPEADLSPQYSSVVSHASCYLQQSTPSVNGGQIPMSVGNTPSTPPSYVMPPSCHSVSSGVKNSEPEERRYVEENTVVGKSIVFLLTFK